MIPKSKKGADIAINVIIFVAIALIVLVVVLYIFGSKSANFTAGLADCRLQQGQCSPETSCNGPVVRNTSCEKTLDDNNRPEICCIKI